MRIEIILLGIIQGLTEWIPISSTGHLRLAEIILKLQLPLFFDIALHIGTLVIINFFFREDVRKVLVALVRLDLSRSEGGIILKRILVGTIFTAIIGSILVPFESLFYEVRIIGLLFLLSGLITYLSRIKIARKSFIDLKVAATIGVVQGLSIMPGLSRSGLTISVALMLGISREEAFKFSFLLSIPATLGGLVLTSITQHNTLYGAGLDIGEILSGILISALLGYLSLRILRKTLKHFHKFAFYPLLLGSLLALLGN